MNEAKAGDLRWNVDYKKHPHQSRFIIHLREELSINTFKYDAWLVMDDGRSAYPYCQGGVGGWFVDAPLLTPEEVIEARLPIGFLLAYGGKQ